MKLTLELLVKVAKRGLSKDQVCVLVATDRENHFLEFITDGLKS